MQKKLTIKDFHNPFCYKIFIFLSANLHMQRGKSQKLDISAFFELTFKKNGACEKAIR